MRDFFREICKEEDRRFSDKDIVSFIKFCERDFFDWLKTNYNYFLTNK
ncbi:MAG: hypothetical protein KJ879_03100 [Nanoarchaeota archaeon]|nr:hypothetical protein [Nanoarchaeota archaeon]